jgi:uncharacterized heparinase superfamily protein
MIGKSRFRFLSEVHDIASAQDWNRSDRPKLWNYNAHYFDDLNATDAHERRTWHLALLCRWVIENPPTRGDAWESYPTSLRIVNWIKWSLQGNALSASCVHSLSIQARWLRSRLETHLLGNHLWANAKALAFSGAYFEGDEPATWLSAAIRLLREQLVEQILDDGGHFERSPMYHAIILEDVLDLIQLSACFPSVFEQTDVELWKHVAAKMLTWLRTMVHPDGDIAFFNDAAFGIAPSYKALVDYSDAIGSIALNAVRSPAEWLKESGYVRAWVGDAVLIADVGDVGPDYLPGHAHADTLSFELSIGEKRVLVNGGTSTYEANNERARQRGTAAHNTVVVDDHDSSEVWSSFRVGRRARPHFTRVDAGEGSISLEATHDGYRWLPSKIMHTRHWLLREKSLDITDRVSGKPVAAVSHWHVHPQFDAEVGNSGEVNIRERVSGEVVLRLTFDDKSPKIAADWWCPSFGVRQASQVIRAAISGGSGEVKIRW